jgi:hypothetical protein
VFYGFGEKVYYKNRNGPSADDIYVHDWKAKKDFRSVENLKKRVVKHDKTEDEKNHP